MEYVTDDGEIIRVGLEVKSKQNTPARTSLHSMRQPDSAHAKQIVAYAEMYGVDYFVILYINYAKKGWFMSDEEYEKTPDIRAFCAKVEPEHKRQVFSKAVEVTRAVREGVPPKLDLDGWTFNNFKEACANDLSEEEVEELRKQVDIAKGSSMPKFKIANYVRAFDDIMRLRKGSE